MLADVSNESRVNSDMDVLRHVVGVHAVADQKAEELNEIFWDTVAHLKEQCDVRVVAAVADGASINRLMQKMNATQEVRGSHDVFKSAEVENPFEDEGCKIYLISDVSHLIKKMCNHLENSDVRSRPTPRIPCRRSCQPPSLPPLALLTVQLPSHLSRQPQLPPSPLPRTGSASLDPGGRALDSWRSPSTCCA